MPATPPTTPPTIGPTLVPPDSFFWGLDDEEDSGDEVDVDADELDVAEARAVTVLTIALPSWLRVEVTSLGVWEVADAELDEVVDFELEEDDDELEDDDV